MAIYGYARKPDDTYQEHLWVTRYSSLSGSSRIPLRQVWSLVLQCTKNAPKAVLTAKDKPLVEFAKGDFTEVEDAITSTGK